MLRQVRTRTRALLAGGLVLVVTLAALAAASGTPAAAQTGREPTPMPLYALPGRNAALQTSGTLALASDNLTVAVANMLSNSITLLVPSQGRIIAELPVGLDPRGIVFTADGSRVLGANRGDDTLSVVGIAEQSTLATIPLGRFSTPEDIGNAACYLCSDEASMVASGGLLVDGGRFV